MEADAVGVDPHTLNPARREVDREAFMTRFSGNRLLGFALHALSHIRVISSHFSAPIHRSHGGVGTISRPSRKTRMGFGLAAASCL